MVQRGTVLIEQADLEISGKGGREIPGHNAVNFLVTKDMPKWRCISANVE